jgi:hypothetical protein
MEGLAIFALLVVPPLLLVSLRHTRFYWLAGLVVLAVAFYMFSLVGPTDSDESDPGLSAIGNAVSVAAGIGLSLYGLILLVVSSRSHDAHLERVQKLPPTATARAASKR